MASVPLDFTAPDWPNLTIMRIYEAPAQGGPWTEIEEVTPVGTYPDYISRYTTNMATSELSWFSIEWEDNKGAKSPLSNPIQVGQNSLAAEITSRAMLRNPNLNEMVVYQSAQGVIATIYGDVIPDPDDVPYDTLDGMTMLTMARTMIFDVATAAAAGNVSKFTAGLVSMETGSTSGSSTGDPFKTVDALIKAANALLGVDYSVILFLKEIEIAGGLAGIVSWDQSRLLMEIE